MSLLDRVQKQQGPDPSAVPEGYVPTAGNNQSRQGPAPVRTRTSFELQAERVKNRLQARLIEQTAADDTEDEDREQRAARITEALNVVVTEMGLSLTKPEKQRMLESV